MCVFAVEQSSDVLSVFIEANRKVLRFVWLSIFCRKFIHKAEAWHTVKEQSWQNHTTIGDAPAYLFLYQQELLCANA